jgi:hypothetical protein
MSGKWSKISTLAVEDGEISVRSGKQMRLKSKVAFPIRNVSPVV